MSELGEKLTRDLTVRYIGVLAILGGLAIALFLGLARILMDAQSGAAVVATAGRQRMLVEQSALSATRLVLLSPASAERGQVEQTLSRAIDQLESSHQGLLQGLPEVKGAKPPSAAVRAIYFGPVAQLDAQLRAFTASARVLADRAASARIKADDPELTALVAAAEGPLLAAIELLTNRYRHENEERLVELLTYLGAAVATLLFFLIITGVGVFQPMVARIRADIEERSKSEKDLRDSEERLWRILEESPVGVSASRRSDGQIVFANTRFCEILGMAKGEFVGSAARDHYVDDAQRRRVLADLRDHGHIDDAEVEFRKKDGSPFWSLLTLRPTHFEGEAVNLAWIYDITERKAVEEKLKLTAKVVETASEAVVITNARNQIEFINPAFTAITEYTAEEVLGQNPKMLQSGRHDADFYRDMWRVMEETGRWQGEIWNRRKSGEFYAEWLSIVAIRDDGGNLTHHVAVFSDITHRKEDEERVWRQANYDALTGLPNRSLFVDRLSQAVRQCRRDNKKFALMFIDLDGFKQVNDTLGHAAGDLLLQQTAGRLQDCMRSSDTVARLAGDEFTIILQGIRGREDAAVVAGKILEGLSQPFDLEGRPAQVRGSIGIAVFPDNAPDGTELLKLADEAMYAVKKHGKNNFEFVDEALAAERVAAG